MSLIWQHKTFPGKVSLQNQLTKKDKSHLFGSVEYNREWRTVPQILNLKNKINNHYQVGDFLLGPASMGASPSLGPAQVGSHIEATHPGSLLLWMQTIEPLTAASQNPAHIQKQGPNSKETQGGIQAAEECHRQKCLQGKERPRSTWQQGVHTQSCLCLLGHIMQNGPFWIDPTWLLRLGYPNREENFWRQNR